MEVNALRWNRVGKESTESDISSDVNKVWTLKAKAKAWTLKVKAWTLKAKAWTLKAKAATLSVKLHFNTYFCSTATTAPIKCLFSQRIGILWVLKLQDSKKYV